MARVVVESSPPLRSTTAFFDLESDISGKLVLMLVSLAFFLFFP